jgi:hypothetical protein
MRRDAKRRVYASFRSAGARRLRHSATRTPPSASARTPKCLGIAILVEQRCKPLAAASPGHDVSGCAAPDGATAMDDLDRELRGLCTRLAALSSRA